MLPILRGNYFGSDAYHRLYSVTGPIANTLIFVVPLGAGYLADRSGSYEGAFFGISAVMTCAVVLAMLMRPPKEPART